MSSLKLINKDDGLYIDVYGTLVKVVKAWESFTGWFWFAYDRWEDRYVTKDGEQYAIEYKEGNGAKQKPPHAKTDRLTDVIWMGLVQGDAEEIGTISESELNEFIKTGHVWELKPDTWSYAGRRH